MKVMNGNSAAAEAVRQVGPDVVLVHPVTPTAPAVERLASFVSGGAMDAELVGIESGASALGGCIGASAAGGRVFTLSSSQGLASMQEALYIASSMRLPVVMGVVDRALSAPENLHADHSDAMAQRDSGWIQLFSENPQEVYDNLVQAFKVAERDDVRTPVMVGMDAYVTSHSLENITIEETPEIHEFIGKFTPRHSLLDSAHPVTMGSHASPDYYFEHKVNQAQGMGGARRAVREVGKEYGDRFGRYYGYFESYKLDDADCAVVIMGSAAGTAKEAVDQLRAQGEKIGVLKVRVFKPFPYGEIREALSGVGAVAVLDRAMSPGSVGGPLFAETRGALYDLERRPLVVPYVYGLGGRDIDAGHFVDIFKGLKAAGEKEEPDGDTDGATRWVHVRT